MAKVTVLAMAGKKALWQRSANACRGGSQVPARRLPAALRAALSALCTVSALLACPAGAATWEIVPTFSADETYTDNVTLSAAGTERSDWVTTLSPGLSVRGRGDRLRLDATYSPQLLGRARDGGKDVIHQLNAGGNAEFIKRTLFLDVRSTVSDQNVSLLGPQTDSNVNVTGNRASVRSFLVSPFVRHDFGFDAQGEARLSYSRVNTDSSADTGSATALADSRATDLEVKLTSGPTFKLLTWNTAYSRQRIDYNQSEVQNIDTQRISAGAKRLITPQMGLLANVGYEDHNYLTTGPAPKGAFWNIGPEWNPTPRTRFAATMGRNYLGPSRSLDFSHRTRRTVWTANYGEEITTTRTQVLVPSTVNTAGYLDALFLSSIPDQAARQAAINAYIAQNGLPPSINVPLGSFTSTPFLAKRFQGSIGIHGARNTLLANLYTQTSEALSPGQPGEGDFAESANTRQTGASVLWTAHLSARTASNMNVGITRNKFDATGREDTQKFIRLGVTHQFHPEVSGTLNFRRLQSISSQSGAGYSENAVSAAIFAKF